MTTMKNRIAALERGNMGEGLPHWLRAWLGHSLSADERERAHEQEADVEAPVLEPARVSKEMVEWLQQ